ncbi:chemotaxis protein [Burkholderia stabilis]|uniref:CheY-P phosphatase CheC,flagellar motor switch protein,Chemotaxis protein CheC, inhibitor of MCP methylation,CheC-like family n=1 Tax=Burkholderia stabilis TaxID=95485 RepID=A0AAJ5NH88_9BURK|nr:chemotaxis protein CheC [Burkholderia stabilis]AOR71313.1 chemotaxis protein [Burkholderia stabilis]VBB15401.1 CheY-P phosphatase CheC,flagellar motor switch protein,Chemotaxis protein CheC, inhibitor of MCP methylation,CheC-like family [Burkholderia stabilis]HDR9490742.1 chemotaxis protein CheC [Burkholderia stabilis]HDR9522968.1 chemotaxis protein CheC [Burkholderia stabilis]HDR9530849.1 chemotaxis protein CheC [Burkholderia stabilis]
MPESVFTAEQRDALQEIANLAMGRAAARLALLLGRFIELSVPRVRVVKAADAGDALREMTGIHDNVTAVRQGFRSDIKGEAIVLCRSAGVARLMSIVDRTFGDGVYGGMATPDELVFDVANVLMGACVASILDELGRKPVFFPPGLLGSNVSFDDVFQPNVLGWSVALLLEVNFGLEDHAFRAHFVMLMAEDSIRLMGDALDALLSAL